MDTTGRVDVLALFGNNVRATVFSIAYGFIPFIYLPALSIGINSLLLGLFAGCVWDLHAAKSAGFNALFFMLLCFGVSAVMERYIRSTFVTHMLFALPAPFLYGLLYWLCFILIKGVDGGTNTLFTFYLPCALYTAVVAPILWFLLRPLRQRLNRKALQ